MNHPMYLAHAFGVRYELPIPLVAFVLGGAAVVAASFLVVLPSSVRPDTRTGSDQPNVRRVPILGGIVGVVITGLLCWAGFAGDQEIPENILPTLFWVYVWVVIPLLCGILGDFTSGANPFGFVAQLGERLRRGTALTWPRWLGWWPAVLLLGAGTLAELVFNASTTLPRFIAAMTVCYAAYCLIMGAVFGATVFRSRGELFSVLFDAWGRLGYFRFGAAGNRGWGGGLARPFDRSVSRTVFILMLLVAISFDGVLSTPQWSRFENNRVSFGDLHGQELLRSVTFVVLIVALYALFGLFAVGVRSAGRNGLSLRDTLSLLLPSLVPIAFGYLLAHYLQYVLINGQLILPLLGAPGGSGTDLHLPYPFNDSYEVHTHFLPNGFYWYFDVVDIVAVHIMAIVLAHRALGRTAATERTARRSEYPWIVAMVAYTSLSLWLLAQPLTEAKKPPPPQQNVAAPAQVAAVAASTHRAAAAPAAGPVRPSGSDPRSAAETSALPAGTRFGTTRPG